MKSDLETPVHNSPAQASIGVTEDRRALWVWLALWITLLVFGVISAPVPGVNEPHYLGKAKHFWNPAWCPGDLLYESSNAHWVFYFVMGYWANWLSLPQLAWAGRAVGCGLLALGWLRAMHVLGLVRGQAWWSLLGFLALASWGNFSGEWLVGGIEGKVFSYGFLFLAFADWQLQRSYRATLWAGLAISFHPLAGGWAVLAAVLAQGVEMLRTRQRPAWADALGGGILVVAALPGVIPALELLTAPDPRGVRINGTFLQVYYRLAHHLDPMTFPARSWWCYAGLCLIAVLFSRFLLRSRAGQMWLLIACWATVFAVCGVIAGYGPRPASKMPYYLERMLLLKFYPFRLFDVVVPLTVAIQGSLWLFGNSKSPLSLTLSPEAGARGPGMESPADQSLSRALLAATVLFGVIAGGIWRQQQFHKPTVFDSQAWVDVCRWIKDHTLPGALVQAPVHNQNFKWFAERAEYVSYKDVPQDNASLVKWNNRMLFLKKWFQDHHADGIYTNDELRDFRIETGITHLVTDRLGPFELPPCYTNDTFRVYDLTELDQ